MKWSAEGPYQRIGGMELAMPVAVVKFTQDRLHEQPAKWDVSTTFLSKPRQQLAISVGSDKAGVSFLVTPQSWCLLNEQSLPCINEVLGQNLDRRSLYNEKKLHDYLATLDGMLLGQGLNLDNEFVSREITSTYGRRSSRMWLKGRVTSIKALQQLCHRPIVTVQGHQVTITYNRVTLPGAVLRRAIHARLGKWLTVTGLEEFKIQPERSISYPYILG